MNSDRGPFDFKERARLAVLQDGFVPDFPADVLSEIAIQKATPNESAPSVRDLTALLWSSIDNTESKDLDQVEFAEALPTGCIRVLIGIADVDARVVHGSAIDQFARRNATSVYTGAMTFPMLPAELSNQLSSLNANEERLALVAELTIGAGGEVVSNLVYRARIKNAAKLSYDEVGDWLDGKTSVPDKVKNVAGLTEQLRLQKTAADRLMLLRQRNGTLTFGGVEVTPVIRDNEVKAFSSVQPNAARKIIECFMVSANVAMAGFLRGKKIPCIRRVVRTPKRWDRIREVAQQLGTTLPELPDSRSLSDFLRTRKDADPLHFPDLSLTIVKLLGPGEYIVEHVGDEREGHFGLAVHDYTHSTAPNRRYADLIVQRLIKGALAGTDACYTEIELSEIAAHCSERENAARHVERVMRKVAAAAMLSDEIGRTFDGIITGMSQKGTFVRLLKAPAEGRIVRGERGLDVGDKVRVRLISVRINEGFIDFEAI
ncbi:MAG: exoribonuclease [Verrucomicrobiales bacterium]|nr:exoribonuclease [Verrucomicrobiales bacterium]